MADLPVSGWDAAALNCRYFPRASGVWCVCIRGWRRQICRNEWALLFPQDRGSKSGLTADLIWRRRQQRRPSLLLLPFLFTLTMAEPHKGFIVPPWLHLWHTHTLKAPLPCGQHWHPVKVVLNCIKIVQRLLQIYMWIRESRGNYSRPEPLIE